MKAITIVCLSLLISLALGWGETNPSGTKPWEEFSGEKALAHVQHLVDLGPRPSGSDTLEKSRAYISTQLASFGWKVTRQQFTDETPKGKVTFVNLIARFGEPSAEPKSLFLLCSHYDTKIFETFRFVGANDGGSSTGALLEMARVLGRHPALAARIEIVFFDGEEAFESFSQTDGVYGSRHFASDLASNKQTNRFRGGILFDMIGDRSLTITLPPDSPADLTRQIFTAADALKLRNYFTYFDSDITDDHTPLNAVGIPTVDLIDFDFSYWHTVDDTMDKISADSLQKVGSVTAYFLSEFALK